MSGAQALGVEDLGVVEEEITRLRDWEIERFGGEDSQSPVPSPQSPIPNTQYPIPTPLTALLESLLFVADEPVGPEKLAKALDRTVSEVEAGLAALRAEYEEKNRGVRLQWHKGQVQMVTNPLAAQAVEDFLNLDMTTSLSGPALEALAVVAYRQPVTRAQIEAVRGVDCSGVLRKLQQQGLIDEIGRLEAPGRPILYGVTDLFMQHFGLTSLDQLPQLPEADIESLQAVLDLADEEFEGDVEQNSEEDAP